MNQYRPNQRWALGLASIQARLHEPLWWFPFPILLPFGLVMLLTAHVLFSTNPRMGNPADVITFPSESRHDSAIWLSVTPIGDDIVVTTNDRKVFRWPQRIREARQLAPLASYLRERVAKEVAAAAMMKKALKTQTTLVIAADQRLKYLHIRPLIHTLAEVGIINYAFETQNPVVAARATDHSRSSPTE